MGNSGDGTTSAESEAVKCLSDHRDPDTAWYPYSRGRVRIGVPAFYERIGILSVVLLWGITGFFPGLALRLHAGAGVEGLETGFVFVIRYLAPFLVLAFYAVKAAPHRDRVLSAYGTFAGKRGVKGIVMLVIMLRLLYGASGTVVSAFTQLVAPETWVSIQGKELQVSFLSSGELALFAVVFAPVLEELLFRGVLLNRLAARFGMGASVVITSLFFAFLHDAPWGFPGMFVFGLICCRLYLESGSLFPAVAFHFLNNSVYLASDLAGRIMRGGSLAEGSQGSLGVPVPQEGGVVIVTMVIGAFLLMPVLLWFRNRFAEPA